MKHFLLVSIFLFLFSVSNGFCIETTQEVKIKKITAHDILKLVENRNVGKTSTANMEMVLKSNTSAPKKRKMKMNRSKKDNLNQNLFIHFLSPADIKNTTYLVKEKDKKKKKWIYLSSFRKRRRLVSNDNSSNFVSSDFTYEDLETIHADDYNCFELKDNVVAGVPVYSFIAVKKDQESTLYSKLVFNVSKKTDIALVILMFNKKKEHVKTLTVGKIKKIQNIWTPFYTKMVDLKNKSYTVLSIKKIKYNLKLKEETFTTRNMEK
jgi:hypothetical protein